MQPQKTLIASLLKSKAGLQTELSRRLGYRRVQVVCTAITRNSMGLANQQRYTSEVNAMLGTTYTAEAMFSPVPQDQELPPYRRPHIARGILIATILKQHKGLNKRLAAIVGVQATTLGWVLRSKDPRISTVIRYAHALNQLLGTQYDPIALFTCDDDDASFWESSGTEVSAKTSWWSPQGYAWWKRARQRFGGSSPWSEWDV